MTDVFTITAKNYLALALNLGESLRATNPGFRFTIFVVEDDLSGIREEDKTRFSIVAAKDLNIDDYGSMKFRYDVIELNTAIKPFCFEFLKRTASSENIIYLDPDIQVFGSLVPVLSGLGDKLLAVTPHYLRLQSPWTGGVPEANFLISGVYNLGFLALNARHAEYDAVLNWWSQRLKEQCYLDRMDGLFYDQNWIMVLAATHWSQMVVLSDPGLNCAWWNLHERTLVKNTEGVVVTCGHEVSPLSFFHFSGYKIGDTFAMNRRYSANERLQLDRFADSAVPQLFQDYSASVTQCGHPYYNGIAYQFDSFSDGTPILRLHRRLLRVHQDRLPRRLDQYQAALRETYQAFSLPSQNYFDAKGDFFRLLRENGLLVKENTIDRVSPDKDSEKFGAAQKLVSGLLRLTKVLIGAQNFLLLMRFLGYYSREEYMLYLMKLPRSTSKR